MKKNRARDFKEVQIDKFTSAYMDILWKLSTLNSLEDEDFDLYEIVADINRELSEMAGAFEQMYTHSLNLERKGEELEAK